jgi:hypothetical protein
VVEAPFPGAAKVLLGAQAAVADQHEGSQTFQAAQPLGHGPAVGATAQADVKDHHLGDKTRRRRQGLLAALAGEHVVAPHLQKYGEAGDCVGGVFD